jgi:tetratricopeptide (TPR) repeat protein
MSRRRQEEKRGAKARSSLLRRLVPALAGLAGLAVGVNFYFWLNQPKLEPLPRVATESLEPAVRTLIEGAQAEAAQKGRSATAWGDLGAVLRAHDLGLEAEACYRNAQRLDPADYRWPYLLGVSLATTDAERAVACFRQAAERCGNRPHVQLRLAEMLLDRGEREEAAVLIEKVLAYAPSDPRGQLNKARLLFLEGKLPEAKSWAERSAASADDKRAPQQLLAQLCRRTGDADGEARAVAALARIADGITPWEDPDVAAVLALRQDRSARLAKAEDLAAGGDTMEAAQILAELAAGNDSASAAAQLARNYNQQKRFAEAEALLRGQLPHSPSDERLHFELGVALFQQQKYAPAAGEFRRVTELKPDHADAFYNLGHALLKLNRKEEARDSFAVAVRLSPSHAFARINLAELLLDSGQPEAAREHLQAALRIAPQDKRAQELFARAKKN